MIFAVDVGNTNIVLGCVENGEILNTVRIQTNTKETSAEYAIKLKQVMEVYGIDPKGFEGAIISSVVPQVTLSLTTAIKKLTGIEAMIVTPDLHMGMDICIDDPSTLGADLVAGSLAAISCYGMPCIIIDMGTATTVFVVDAEKRFCGGAILPGVKLSYAALAAGTSLLPDISITPPEKCIAANTVDCMRSGAVYGTAATLDGLIERMESELGQKCTVVATGGLAQWVTPYCRREIICDNDLLLKGLWILYQQNK